MGWLKDLISVGGKVAGKVAGAVLDAVSAEHTVVGQLANKLKGVETNLLPAQTTANVLLPAGTGLPNLGQVQSATSKSVAASPQDAESSGGFSLFNYSFGDNAFAFVVIIGCIIGYLFFFKKGK